MQLNKLLFLIPLAIVLLFSCNEKSNKYSDTPTSGKVKIGVDETFKPFIDSEINVFNAIYNLAEVIVEYKTEEKIFEELLKDSIRMIVSSRMLNEREKLHFKQIKYFPKETKIAIDAIALLVNNANPDSNLTMDAIRGIFNGSLTSWKQINSKSSNDSIQIVFDNTSSSTVRYVLDSICKDTELSKNATALNYNKDVIEFVAKNRNALGIIGVSWVSNRSDSTALSFLNNVKVIGISLEKTATESNSYQPYQAYVVMGKYPLYRNVYMIISEPRIGLATGFGSFLASDRGQRIILKSGILPATQPVRIVHLNQE